MDVSTLNYLLALGTVAMQLVTVGILVALITRSEMGAALVSSASHHGLALLFILAAVGTGMTLYYSDILGFEPCALCWWQRVFLYPQIVLYGMALLKERYRATALDASLVLSAGGLGVALYHHALQMFPNAIPCPAQGVSCAQRIVFELGYVTFPMMAVGLFGFLIALIFVVRRSSSV